MGLKIFNTLGKKIEEFSSIKPGIIKMYTCGPTVYNYGHIGNFRTFVFQDILKRYLKYKGYKVTQIMNITDVDDKTIKCAQKEGKSLREYTEKYTKAFFYDIELLNIDKAEYYPKATDHIDEIIDIINKLIEKGFAYNREGSVYYDVSKFNEYGKLSGIKMSDNKSKSRVKMDEYKDEVRDFALWKKWDKDDGDVFWEPEIGKGRPGWHIECTAMATKYLGNNFDIHSGGIDLIFPHHENEIAQSEAVNNSKFANYWLHSEHLIVEGEKMSKSLGNMYTIKDIIEKGYNGKTLRYLLSSAHYRSKLNFTEAGLNQAKSSIERFQDFFQRIKEFTEGKEHLEIINSCNDVKKRFENAMDNDLNVPEALAVIFDFIRDINRVIDSNESDDLNLTIVTNTIIQLDTVFGFLQFDEEKVPENIKVLIEKREKARISKDWEKADKIRDELLKKGVILEDTVNGVTWKLRK